jgi:RNA-directed DNA polymerase
MREATLPTLTSAAGFRSDDAARPGAESAITKKALVAVMARVKTLCRQSTNLPLNVLLHRLNRMLRGWTTYFKYGCSHATFSYLRSYLWKQVVRWQERKHRRTAWKQPGAL